MAITAFALCTAIGLLAIVLRDGGWAFIFGALAALNGLFAAGVL
jgi:hypothetical protein